MGKFSWMQCFNPTKFCHPEQARSLGVAKDPQSRWSGIVEIQHNSFNFVNSSYVYMWTPRFPPPSMNLELWQLGFCYEECVMFRTRRVLGEMSRDSAKTIRMLAAAKKRRSKDHLRKWHTTNRLSSIAETTRSLSIGFCLLKCYL